MVWPIVVSCQSAVVDPGLSDRVGLGVGRVGIIIIANLTSTVQFIVTSTQRAKEDAHGNT